ncbi:MAG: putative methyltransferase [Solirubrobacterales bacterium]|nr:putative methyltransferase [Solirubrobacterales bacterium]
MQKDGRMSVIAAELSRFGVTVTDRFAMGGGEPEDLLRGPFEQLIGDLAQLANITPVILNGEHHLAAERVRPDYAVYAGGALVGFVELKAPGKGADTSRFKARDKVQWERLACLPNVLYSDGQSWALYRDGERISPVVQLVGDVTTVGKALTATDDALLTLVAEFLRWKPIAPRRPRELARVSARLCRVLRAEVGELLAEESTGLRDLAEDWRRLLYPNATDSEFADGYAQTVTFALLLARVENIDLDGRDLREIADDLGSSHTLMARALAALTDPAVLPKLAVSVGTLQRVLAVVDWPKISRADPASWLYFYEDFLDHYDQALRKQTGSYYTPVEAVDPMVRMVDGLLRTRLGHAKGFASAGVTVVDPATGTGTFLFRIVDSIAQQIEGDLGPGAVGAELRKAAKRLIGFELQAGPYSVAELRLATEFERRGAKLGADELRLYLTNTLGDPFVEETNIAATYRPIAESRRRANKVKREEAVVVVIGNPPYRERSKRQGGWVEAGSGAATSPLADFIPRKELGLGAHVKHLYNLYVYFWRWASWKVFEGNPSDRGVVAFVTVAGFLHGPGFARMREHLRRTSDAAWVIDLSPEGHQAEVPTRVFPGVQQPVCIVIAIRDGSTTRDDPAPVKFTAVSGRRDEKFAQLAALELDSGAWELCGDAWDAPLRAASSTAWSAYPGIDELLGWSNSGAQASRTWVIAPSADVLRRRWARLVAAPPEEKGELLVEGRDRQTTTVLSDNLPGYPVRGAIAAETGDVPEPVRYGWRTLDRGWLIPDKRVINYPRPELWQVSTAPGQVYLTALEAHAPSGGPAGSFTALVPDLHHYRGSFGGRAFPLWLDAAGTVPNLVPGLLKALGARLGILVTGADVFAYIAAVIAQPSYVDRHTEDLQTPGLRIPVTASATLFTRAVVTGKRVLWLHTYGERFADPIAGRPSSAPRVVGPGRPLVTVPIPDTTAEMPEDIAHDPAANELHIGRGRISGVTTAMWEYETSGYKIVRRWFAKRKPQPDGRRSSPLDEIVARSWETEWTEELIDMLNVLALLVDMESDQRALLDEIETGDLITVTDLADAGVLPVEPILRPLPELPGKHGYLRVRGDTSATD